MSPNRCKNASVVASGDDTVSDSHASFGFVGPVAESTVPPTALAESNARTTARAELDAFIAARLVSLSTQELSDLLDTFEVLRRREEKADQKFRTKRLILEESF